MVNTRVIPCLLLDGRGLYKTVKFREPKYVGDPINAVKIFNERFVDEIIFLDISATREGLGPNFELIEHISNECFIPFCYGGGISCTEDARRLFYLGVEKISINSAAVANPSFITELAQNFGSQSVIVAMDVKRNWRGKPKVVIGNGKNSTGLCPVEWAQQAVEMGAGELLINSVDRDGTQKGFDKEIAKAITAAVDVPVIVCGGAGDLNHLAEVVSDAGVAGVAAGSLFVFKGKHRAVLINYPSQVELRGLAKSGLQRDGFNSREI